MFGKDAISTSLKLFIITAVAALCLALANQVTAPIIETNEALAVQKALKEVLPQATTFPDQPETSGISENGASVEALYVGSDAEGVVGYVVTAVSNAGYGGDVEVMVGIDKDLKVTKIQILKHSETAGLGANASKPQFAGQFEGKGGQFQVVKGKADDGQISAITSATVTSKAVTSCVNVAVKAAEAKANSTVDAELQKIVKETEEQISEDKSDKEGENEDEKDVA